MTTGAEAIITLKFRLNRGTSASSEFENQLFIELNLAQQRLESEPLLPEFLLTERSYVDLTEGEERIRVPTGFLRENDEDDMQVQDTTATGYEAYSELTKDQLDNIRRRYPDEAIGRPEAYAVQGRYFRLRPIPDKDTYKLWMTYYKAEDEITNTSLTNQWLTYYPDLLISEAGLVLSKVLNNEGAMVLFTEMNQRERLRLQTNEVAMKQANFEPNPED